MKALSPPSLIKRSVFILIFCLAACGNCVAEVEKGEAIYLYGKDGQIKGFETEGYMFDMEGEIIAYKLMDERFVYFYSPEGDRIGYRYRRQSQDELYFYDAEGNIIGYYTRPEIEKPSFEEDPLYKPDVP